MSHPIPIRPARTITSDIEVIDPATAEEYLKRNTHNRPLIDRKVLQLASDMEAGRWQMNGEAIKFATDDSLLDGQHRLHAIALSGVPVESIVVRGLPPETQTTMDQGTKRSPSDQLNLSGITASKSDASAAKTLIVWDRGWFYTDKATGSVTSSEIVQWAIDHPDVFELIRRGTHYVRIKARRGLVMAAFAGIARHHGIEVTHEFFQRTLDGIGLEVGSPILALRNRLDRIRGEGFKMPDAEAIGYFVMAFNHWAAGHHIARLQQPKGGWHKGNFPQIVTRPVQGVLR
ncbi:hypothetical protein E3G52_000283 [Mycobacteroides abscessus]|uniref:hypothetical protein n=1 Tax=Mycobacteroides abscessus TaxID=36809 RepID=UPI001878E5A6|nr:hypothetical protein [Mycobacteroides abscessus]MBE5453419.1 hypothetical protein [Mycobacteroides abscessus]